MLFVLRTLVQICAISLCLGGGSEILGQSPTETKDKSSASERPQRLKVPSDAAQQNALKLVNDIYKEEIRAAKTPEAKEALAKMFLEKSHQMTDDVEGRFVLYGLAEDIASQAGDRATAFEVVEETARVYEVDVLELKAETMSRLFKAAHDQTERTALIQYSRQLIEEIVTEEHYDLAQQVGRDALTAAQRTTDKDLIQLFVKFTKDIKKQATAFAAYQKGRETLTNDPTDAKANLAVGRYLCFVRDDWESGMPYLAKSSEEKLKALAQRELANPPTEPEGQVSLADAWWDFAQVEDGKENDNLQNHAAIWYQRAVGKLPNGLSKTKVDKRLEKIDNKQEEETGTVVKQKSNSTKRISQVLTLQGVQTDGLGVDTLFVGQHFGHLDSKQSQFSLCRKVTQRRKVVHLSYADHVVVLKPHGSLDWYLHNHNPVRCPLPLANQRLIITPGLNKFRGGYDRPFDAHRERANKEIDNAARYLIVGYSFNDDHLQTHLEPQLKSGKPSLLITHSLSAKAEALISQCNGIIALSADVTRNGTIITTKDKSFFLPGSQWWDLGIFTSEVLEP